MFSAATPLRKPHTRASAASRRSQSRAGSVASAAGHGSPAPGAGASTPTVLTPRAGPSTRRTTAGAASALRSRGTGYQYPNEERDDVESESEEEADDLAVARRPEGDLLEGVLLKTETHAVAFYGSLLPIEVQQVLQDNDFYTHPYSAHLDHSNGYACLVGRESCYVWELRKPSNTSSSNSAPTCYVFPVPQSSTLSLSATVFSPVPLVAFVNASSADHGAGSSEQREPGLILMATHGQVSFWSSITAALSDVDRRSTSTIPLTAGEVVRALHKISTTHFLAATSGARLFSLRISNPLSFTNAAIQISQLSRTRGVLARVGGLFGGASTDPRAGILALTSAAISGPPRTERNVFAVSDRAVQVWSVSGGSSEQFLHEADVYDSLVDVLTQRLSSARLSQLGTLSPEIVDARALTAESLVLLVSFARPVQASSSRIARSTNTQAGYALVTWTRGAIDTCRILSFTNEPDPRPLSSPKLVIGPDASKQHQLAYVVFPDILLMTTLSPSLPFEESVSLRDSAHDRVLGSVASSPTTLLLFAASSGLLRLDVAYDAVTAQTGPSMSIDADSLATQNLKGKLDQAVMFSDRSSNPLAFDLKLESEGDLVWAAERLSKEILNSSAPNLPRIIDMRAQLEDRANRLRSLMIFIHDNSLMGRLSRTSKRHLAWDAEKVQSALALWHVQNAGLQAKLGTSDLGMQESLLEQAIASLNATAINARQTQGPQDTARTFFRTQLDMLGLLLEQLLPLLAAWTSTPGTTAQRPEVVGQAAQYLVASYKAVNRFRKESAGLYGINDGSQTCLSEPWSSKPSLLELLRLTFEQLAYVISARTRELGGNVDNESLRQQDSSSISQTQNDAALAAQRTLQQSLKEQIVELGDFALSMHQERMAHLQSLGDDAKAVGELRSLADIYVNLRTKVVHSLVSIDRVNIAYDLAERYRDFRSLVQLCNDPRTGSPLRVQFYIERYREDFAFALYTWYREQNRPFDLISQDQVYWPYLSKYLDQSELKRLSWLQSIAERKYEKAADALLEEASRETRLAEQKLMLSIGKLARVAKMTRAQLQDSEEAQKVVESVDDRLDIVASHDKLLEACQSVLDARDLARNMQSQAEACAERLYARVRGPLRSLVVALLRRLLTGASLSTEDLVDLYSLKASTRAEEHTTFTHALDIIVRDRMTPSARLQLALRTLWRRVYLQNDWLAIRQSVSSQSDEAIAQSLRSTALFTTLLNLLERNDHQGASDKLRMRPTAASSPTNKDSNSVAQAGEAEALRTRFASSSVSSESRIDLDSIIEEFARERDSLASLVQNEDVRMEEFFDEVERLASLAHESEEGQMALEGDSSQTQALDTMDMV